MLSIAFLLLLFANCVKLDKIQTHELDIEWLNEFMHRSAILALLKTKATVLKRELPETEAIIYSQCASTAKSPSTLAGCVVKLMNARDGMKMEDGKIRAEPKSQAELYQQMQELIDEVLGKGEVESRIEPVKVLYRPKKSVHENTALQNLQRIQRYMTMIEKYNKQLVKLNDENAKFINQASLSNIQFKVQPKHNLTMMDKVLGLINSFKSSKNAGKLSILSPKFLSIIPSRKSRPKLLSPTLFSFQQDGMFSLPQLFQLASISRNETDAWLQTLLQLSGADKELHKIVQTLEFQLNEFEHKIQPRLIELERWQRQLKRVRQTYSNEQQKELKMNGYTFLSPDQMSLVYGSPLAPTLSNEAKMFAHMTIEQREKRLEDDIRDLAKLNSMIPSNLHSTQNIKTRLKRQSESQAKAQKLNGPVEDEVEISQNVEVKYGSAAVTKNKKIQKDEGGEDFVKVESTLNSSFNTTNGDCIENDSNCSPLRPPTSTQKQVEPSEKGLNEEGSSKEEKEELPKFETLKPFAFGSKINEAVVLEGLTLSPYAFFSQIAQPEMLNFEILSPRAFVPSILSPSALIARVLSPAAFRAEILSPRTLVAWVLTPEALILEVLSPKAIETRILSPEALIIQVLSPNTLAPKIYSPEALGVVVLSPSFLSPRFMSKEKMMVEVLSPNILGGGSSEESKEHGSKEHGSNEHTEHTEDCEHEGSGENHLHVEENNVQPTWNLKNPENGQSVPIRTDSTAKLYPMHDWEN